MEGSSTDRYIPEERVWIHVLPRYARILVPDETKHYKTVSASRRAESKAVKKHISTQTDPWEVVGMAPPSEDMDDTQEQSQDPSVELKEKPYWMGVSQERIAPSNQTEEDYAPTEYEDTFPETDTMEEQSTGTDAEPKRLQRFDPPTTSKAPPPTPHSSSICTEEPGERSDTESKKREIYHEKRSAPYSDSSKNLQSQPRERKRARHLKDPKKGDEARVKDEGVPLSESDRELHHRLTGLLPHHLDPRTDGELRANIELISEQQPEWLRSQIRKELRDRSIKQGWPITSRQANTVMWRNYRLKITQITALFGVEGMKTVVDLCLGEEDPTRSQTLATG